ncbi:MAG: TolC family protein [Phycisphaerales bacterium]|nr:TolC family protein [Phycisphaerales bacterium]
MTNKNTPWHRRPACVPHAQLLATGLLAYTLCAGGCMSNPFKQGPLDTHTVTTKERLHNIGVFQLQRAPEDSTRHTKAQLTQAQTDYANVQTLDLTLSDARAAALSNNLGLSATLIAPEIAAQRVNQERAAFESVFTLNASWNETDAPTASTLVGSQARNQSITPGIRIPLMTGGNITVSAPINRSANNNSFSTLNPAWTTDLEISLSHNLLRNAGRRATTHALRLADYDRQTSLAQTKLEVIRVLANVDRAYWRLYASTKALEVVEQQYTVAQTQLASAQRKRNAGTGTDVDIVRAQSGVADRVEAIIRAQNDVKLQQRTLKQLINMPGLTVDTTTRIIADSTPDPVEYLYDLNQLTTAAVQNRMEMLELQIQLARQAAAIGFAENQKLPLIALNYTYRINGLAGSLENSVDVLAQNEFEDWSIGLNAEFPLGNEAAKASLAQAILARLQSLATRDARQQSITTEVLNAVDNLQSTWHRILASQESVLLNARLLAAEKRQFDVGRSTSTIVLDADANLANARLSEIRAIVDYQIAQIDLAVASGTLLGQAKVEWNSDPKILDDDHRTKANQGVTPYKPSSGIWTKP